MTFTTEYSTSADVTSVNEQSNYITNNLIQAYNHDNETYDENATSLNVTLLSNVTLLVAPIRRVILIAGVGSLAEQVILELYLSWSLLSATILNFTILFSILRDWRALAKRPENVIIFGDCINNLMLTYGIQPLLMWTIAVEYPTTPVFWICQANGTISTAALIFTMHSLCLYSFERYYFLCHPMEYNRRMKVPLVFGIYLGLYAFSYVMAQLTALQGRVFFVTGGVCQSSTANVGTIILFVMYAGPALFMAFFAVYRIKGLQSRSIGPAKDTQQAVAVSTKTEKVEKRRQISAIKTIILTSGSTLMTIFPMSAIRLGVLNSGVVSPADLELRRKPLYTILFRVSYILMVTTTPFLNPVFYLAMRKNLRDGLPCVKWFRSRMKAMGRQVDFEPSHSIAVDSRRKLANVASVK